MVLSEINTPIPTSLMLKQLHCSTVILYPLDRKQNELLHKQNFKTKEVDYVIASIPDSIQSGFSVETVFKGREKSDQSVSGSLRRCDVEFEKYIQNFKEALATTVNAYDQKMFLLKERTSLTKASDSQKKIHPQCMDEEVFQYNLN